MVCLPLAVLKSGSSVRDPLDKLAFIPLTGNPGWFEIYKDDRIPTIKKNVFTFFYSQTSPFNEFLRILNLVIQRETLVAEKLRGATEIT